MIRAHSLVYYILDEKKRIKSDLEDLVENKERQEAEFEQIFNGAEIQELLR